jgi:hypothetical protein
VHVYVWWGCNQLADKTVKVDVEAITASAREVHVFKCECACSSANARVRVRMRVFECEFAWKILKGVYMSCVRVNYSYVLDQ